MTIGLTGSTGFIGKALVRFLAQHTAASLRCLVRHTPDWQATLGERVEVLRGDLQSPFDCAEFVRGTDHIIHLASAGTPLTAGRSLPDDAALSLTPTLNLLQAIRDNSPDTHIIFASSGGQVYGRSPSHIPWTEECPCQPVSIYGIHKLATEHYLRLLAEESNVRSTVLRIANVYGELLPPERLQGFIGVAIHELIHGRPVRLIGNALNVRDYVHLNDLCHAFLMALSSREATCEIFNIGTGVGASVEDILHLLHTLTDREILTMEVGTASSPSSLIPWNVLNPTKARSAGWTPTISLAQGLRQILQEARWP